MFLVNGVIAHVLLDYGATRSFVSLALNKKFGETPEALDYPFKVDISDDRTVSAIRVHCGCILELFVRGI